MLLRLVNEEAHDFARLAQPGLERVAVGLEVRDRLPGDAGVNRGLGDCGRLPEQHARVEGLGDDVLPAELDAIAAVGAQDGIRYILLGQVREGAHGGDLHLVVDGPGAHVECATEDEREPENVVHLVRVIRAAGGDYHVGTRLGGILVSDLRVRVGHRKHDGIVRHRTHHLPRDDSLCGDPAKHIRPLQRVGEGARLGVLREILLVGIHPFAAPLEHDPFRVDQGDVLVPDPELLVQLGAGDASRAGSAEDDPNLLDLLADDLDGVQEGSPADDRRAVLVVVEHGDVHQALELFFDVEALRGLDVLQVDAAERGFEQQDGLDDVVRVVGVQLDIENVHVGEALEQDPFAFHDRLAGQRANVAQAEHGGAVGHHGYQVPLRGVQVGVVRVRRDCQARLGDPGSVGQRQVALSLAGFCGDDFDLSPPAL